MTKILTETAFGQWLSASFVVLAGLIMGKGAAHGMSVEQWGYSCLILASSILLAVMIWSPTDQNQADGEPE